MAIFNPANQGSQGAHAMFNNINQAMQKLQEQKQLEAQEMEAKQAQMMNQQMMQSIAEKATPEMAKQMGAEQGPPPEMTN